MVPRSEALLRLLFTTFQLELFGLTMTWVDSAKDEIATCPMTDGLVRTDRTEAILRSVLERRSVLGRYEGRSRRW